VRYLLVLKNNTTLIILIVAGAFYSAVYFLHPVVNSPLVWDNWHDQSVYFLMANKLMDGSFSAADYKEYGLGYPILAIPFIVLFRDSIFYYHSFFIPNLLMFLATVYLTFSLMKKSTKNFWLPILGISAFLFVSPYLIWFVEPWNGHIADFGIIAIVYFLMRDPDTVTKKSIIFASLLAGWMFAARYVEIIWVLPIFIAFFIFKPKKMLYFFPCIIIICLVLFSHWVYLDDPLWLLSKGNSQFITNESRLHEKTGIGIINLDITTLANRTFCIFFNPLHCIPPETGDEYVDNWWFQSLHNKIPLSIFGLGLLVFSPLGIFLLLRKYEIKQKSILVGLLIGFLGSYIFYTSIFFFTAGWTFFFRYHIFWIPVFAVFSIYGLNFVYQKMRR